MFCASQFKEEYVLNWFVFYNWLGLPLYNNASSKMKESIMVVLSEKTKSVMVFRWRRRTWRKKWMVVRIGRWEITCSLRFILYSRFGSRVNWSSKKITAEKLVLMSEWPVMQGFETIRTNDMAFSIVVLKMRLFGNYRDQFWKLVYILSIFLDKNDMNNNKKIINIQRRGKLYF